MNFHEKKIRHKTDQWYVYDVDPIVTTVGALIDLGSLCTHWYDITDLYQDIIYNNSLMGKTTFAAEVQNQRGKIYFVLLLEM